MNWKIANQYLEKVDITEIITKYIDLEKKGNNFFGKCPFHKDDHPSLSVSKKKQIWKCFVCNIGGNLLRFIMLYENKNLSNALISLGKIANLKIEENLFQKNISEKAKKMMQINREALLFFEITLLNDSQGQKYCDYRKITSKMQQEFQIGLATQNNEKLFKYLQKKKFLETEILNSDLFYLNNNGEKINYFRNRLIFPIKDENGAIIAFSGRSFATHSKQNVKYLISKESELFHKNKHLYNLFYVSEKFKALREIYLTEGFLDAIRLTINNHPSVAMMGVFLSNEQADLLAERYQKVIIFPDNDQAGINSALQSALLLLKKHLDVEIIVNQTKFDADQYLQQNKTLDKLSKCHPIDFLLQQQTKKKLEKIDWQQKDNFNRLLKSYINFLNEEDYAYFFPKIQKITTILKKNNFKPQHNQKKNSPWKKYVLARILHNLNLLSKINFKEMGFNDLKFDYYLNLIEKWYNNLEKNNKDSFYLKLNFNNFITSIKDNNNKKELEKFYFDFANDIEVIVLNKEKIEASLASLRIAFLEANKHEKERILKINKNIFSFEKRSQIREEIIKIQNKIYQLKNEISN